MWRVFDEVGRLATAEGVGIRESELIGLAPQAAFDGVAEHAGAPLHAEPMMVLEQRLAAASAAAG